MVDLSKVSQAVQKFVDEVKSSEGQKKQIDTQGEYDKLAVYLAGNDKELNAAEKEFIQGLMVEYTITEKQAKAAEAEKAFMESVTDETKDVAKDVAKLMGNKKKVDTEAEANELVRYLKENTDLKPSDRKYVENILIESGYEDLLTDRVANLEQRMDDNDFRDAVQTKVLLNNAKKNKDQDEAIQVGQERDDIQDAQILKGQKHDAAQDSAIKKVQQQNAAQDRAIAEGQQHDAAQDGAIAEGQQHDEAQDGAIVRGSLINRAQDRAIAEGRQHDAAQDGAIAEGQQHDAAQDRAIAAGQRRDRFQDYQIDQLNKDLEDHKEGFFRHGIISFFE